MTTTENNKKVALTGFQKMVLLAIKSGFAFLWGFVNAITVVQSGRYATIMTGNLTLLGMQTSDWQVEEMLLTIVLILAYIVGGAAYDFLSLATKNELTIQWIAMSLVLVLGISADVLQYTSMQSCFPQSENGDDEIALRFEDDSVCDASHLYYLSPVSFFTGIAASGYCAAHPDGVITTLMTNHMRVGPNALLKLSFNAARAAGNDEEGDEDTRRIRKQQRSDLFETARTSFVIITFFFCGVLTGYVVENRILQAYFKGKFTPLFTVIAVVLASLCISHSTFYRRFLKPTRKEEEGIDH